MILRAVRVANWRGLRGLSLCDLAPGLNLLYGPNRTGKTSLMEAIRQTLVDWQHDTKLAEAVVPWGTTATPEVSLEFSVHGRSYRVTKRFSKRKAGGAELYELNGDARLLAEGKEVTPHLHRLLGISASKAGLAQLLWVNQGTVEVPPLDEELGNSLRRVLGSVITGQDERFRAALWRRMSAWYSREDLALQGRLLPSSEPRKAEKAVGDWQSEVTRIEAQFAEIDSLLGEEERLRGALAAGEAALHAAAREVEALSAAEQQVHAKRQAWERTRSVVEALRREVRTQEEDAGRYAEYRAAYARAEAEAGKQAAALAPRAQALREAAAVREAAAELRRRAEQAQEAPRAQREELQVKRRLVALAAGGEELSQRIGRVQELQQRITAIEHDLAAVAAPSPRELARLQQLVQRLDHSEAELRAAQLVIRLEVKQPLAVEFRADGGGLESLSPASGEARAWQVRQRARLSLGDLAHVEIARGEDDATLDELAEERMQLAGEFAQQLAKWGVSARERLHVLSELSARATARASVQAELDGLRAQLAQAAPQGAAALQTQHAALEAERAALLTARPSLAEWAPSEPALRAEEQVVSDAEGRLHRELQEARRQAEAAERAFREAERGLQAARDRQQALTVALAESRARLESLDQRHGSAQALEAALAGSRSKLTEAAAELARHRLTAEEEQVAERLASAQEARDRLQREYAESREQRAKLEGRLQQCEGLHARRSAAEQALQAARREQGRLALEVEAHRLLLALFSEARDDSVAQAIGPVSEQVAAWVQALYDEPSVEVAFGADLSVAGVTVGDGLALPVTEATSYGEREQLALLTRLAYGLALAGEERQAVILDDPLAHSDAALHARMLAVLREAAERLQILILTCHPERFAGLDEAAAFDLAAGDDRGQEAGDEGR